MTVVDYGAIVLICGLLLWGVIGTRVIYHEHLTNRTSDMRRSCQTLAGIMIASAAMAFAMGVRWHHVYSDVLHQVSAVAQPAATEMHFADEVEADVVVNHRLVSVTPGGNAVITERDSNGLRIYCRPERGSSGITGQGDSQWTETRRGDRSTAGLEAGQSVCDRRFDWPGRWLGYVLPVVHSEPEPASSVVDHF